MRNKKITIFLLVIFVFAAAVLIYTLKFSGKDDAANKSLTPVGVVDTRVADESVKLNQDLSGQGKEIIRLLSVLKGTDIDASFFDDPFFESFQDFSIQLPVANIGAPNPFAPLGGGEE